MHWLIYNICAKLQYILYFEHHLLLFTFIPLYIKLDCMTDHVDLLITENFFCECQRRTSNRTKVPTIVLT